jgi:hypothetical protein
LPLSAVDCVSPAIQHTQQQLTRPFRFGQWLRLAFVGALAGESASFNGCNFNYPAHSPSPSPHIDRQTAFVAQLPQQINWHSSMVAWLIVLFVAGIGVIVLFTYIGSVMRFILFDSIISKECHVREGWSRRKHDGFQLFQWQILLMVLFFVAAAILIGGPVFCAWQLGWFNGPSQHLAALILGGLGLFFLFCGVLLFFGVIQVMTKDFVVPQMALQGIDAFEGWRRLLPQVNAEKGGYAGYVGMKIVLAIGAAIVFGIATIFGIVILLIPLGAVGAGGVFAGWAMGWTWNPYTIAVAVVYGCIALAVFIAAALLIGVPKVVFFPAYSIYFFAPRFPPLAAVLWPPTPPTPPEKPPLPSPEPIG